MSAMLTYVVVMSIIYHATQSSDVMCPPLCKCSKNFETIACARQGVMRIPKNIPTKVKHLDLSNNLIQAITSDSLRGLRDLEYLDFTSNMLDTIENGSFSDLSSLKKLQLGKNRLTVVPDPEGMPKLEQLVMESNNLKEMVFPPGFLNLTKLKRITMTGNMKVVRLTGESFESLKNCRVSRFYAARCNIAQISNDTFAPLKYLASLQLSYNPIDGEQLVNALQGFNGSKLLISLKLSGLKFDGKFPNGAFSALRKSPIQEIDFSHNVIHEILQDSFSGLPRLTNLNLKSCGLYRIHPSALSDLGKLLFLTLKNNSLTAAPKFLPDSLQTLDLSSNINIRALQNKNFVNLKGLKELFLNNNLIVQVEELTFAGLHKVHTLDLSKNQLPYLPKNVFGPLKSLKYLMLNRNNLKTIQNAKSSPFCTLDKLVYLDLSDNYCDQFPVDLFEGLDKLEQLFLSNNRFGYNLGIDVYDSIFDDLVSLKELHLDNNEIHQLRGGLFRKQCNVKKIVLRDNKISHWSSHQFSETKNMTELDISCNLVSLINSTSVQNFTDQLSLNLTGNPFACTCDLLWFRHQWINTTNVNLLGLRSYTCNSPHDLQNTPLLSWHPDPRSCIDYTPYILSGAVGGTVLLMTLVVGVTYRRRWFIRLSWYKLTHRRGPKRDGYRVIDRPEGVETFDAYLSFCEEDREWVEQTIMARFDKENSQDETAFDLCYDDRDFPPNLSRVGCIYECIENSSKFLVVISKDYEFGGRMEIELHCALQEKIDDDHFEILVVLKDGPPVGKIPRPISHLVSDPDLPACVEWPSDNADGQRLFGDKLWAMLEKGLAGRN